MDVDKSATTRRRAEACTTFTDRRTSANLIPTFAPMCIALPSVFYDTTEVMSTRPLTTTGVRDRVGTATHSDLGAILTCPSMLGPGILEFIARQRYTKTR